MKVASEMARLKAFNPSLPALDFDLETVEMFMDPAMELLEKMQNALLRQDRDNTFLLETMNRDDDSSSILFYFKVCSSRMKEQELIAETLWFRAWLTQLDPDEYLYAIQREPIRAFPGNDSTRLLQIPYRGSLSRDRTGWTSGPD
jgi:hypothetical protein